ncbi:MAG: chemotaxis protein CheD [Candidatus Omnitrophica bacterium]|nr:chemotaxis protein CheD [Candidatus Omnitrophota bacterium]
MEKHLTQEKKIIEVNIAEMKVGFAPDILVTRGLGSCLGIAIYDPLKKIGAIAHPMLPDIDSAKVKSNPYRFVNSAIMKMVEELEKMGGLRSRFVAKIFGGAKMFSSLSQDSILNIGQKNIDMALQVLKDLNIKIAAQDTGGNFGRTVEFDLEDGKTYVNTIFKGKKEI